MGFSDVLAVSVELGWTAEIEAVLWGLKESDLTAASCSTVEVMC